MLKQSTVSVIITTYFENTDLKRAIENVFSQSYTNLEIVVVDDSGEKHAEEVTNNYDEVEYIPHCSNKGQIAGWNTGMSHTSGKYVQFHDDDDYLLEEKIPKQVQFLESNPEVGSVYCGIVGDDGVERLPPEDNRGDVLKPVLLHRMYRCQTTTMLTRRAILDEVFPLHPYPAATDIVLQLELCTKTSFDYLNEPLVHRSLNPEGVGSSLINRKTRLQLIRDYSSLYDDHPELKREVTKQSRYMLGKKHMDIGRSFLEDSVWSPMAIIQIARANYHTPGMRPRYILQLLASLLGVDGYELYKKVRP